MICSVKHTHLIIIIKLYIFCRLKNHFVTYLLDNTSNLNLKRFVGKKSAQNQTCPQTFPLTLYLCIKTFALILFLCFCVNNCIVRNLKCLYYLDFPLQSSNNSCFVRNICSYNIYVHILIHVAQRDVHSDMCFKY